MFKLRKGENFVSGSNFLTAVIHFFKIQNAHLAQEVLCWLDRRSSEGKLRKHQTLQLQRLDYMPGTSFSMLVPLAYTSRLRRDRWHIRGKRRHLLFRYSHCSIQHLSSLGGVTFALRPRYLLGLKGSDGYCNWYCCVVCDMHLCSELRPVSFLCGWRFMPVPSRNSPRRLLVQQRKHLRMENTFITPEYSIWPIYLVQKTYTGCWCVRH